MWFDVLINVFLAVVVREFLPHLDVLDGINPDTALHDIRLAIRLARMVDIASEVLACRTIDRLAAVHLKKIFALACVFFLLRYHPAEILDDALPFLEGARRKEAEPGRRPPDA